MAMQHASDWDRDAALTTARILLEIKAVNFRPEEPYTFTSGWKSPVYIDCRKIIYFPRARNNICDLGVEKIGRHIGYETIDVVAGGETAGIPFAAWIADRMVTPMAYVRKKPKGFGRGAQIEGDVPEGKNTLLVEDLTTDGGSKIRFAQALRDAGAICDHTFVVFYYGVFPGSFEQMKAMGLNLHHLCTWWDVLEVCRERPYFAESALKEVREIPRGPGGLVEGAWRHRLGRGSPGDPRRGGEGIGTAIAGGICSRRAHPSDGTRHRPSSASGMEPLHGRPLAPDPRRRSWPSPRPRPRRAAAARHADHRHHPVPQHLPPQHRQHGGEILRARLRPPAASPPMASTGS